MARQREYIFDPDVLPPSGHYAHAIRDGDYVFVSGILGLERGPKGDVVPEFSRQAEICLQRLVSVLKCSGCDLSSVVKVTVYISDIAFWSKANAVYECHFGESRPARTVVPCAKLHHGCDIVIDAIARA